MPSGMVPQAQRGANTPRQMPVENDETNATGILEPSLMLVSISPLRSLESIVELQISGPGNLWSEDILSEFQDLPDFSLAQTNALTALLRSRQLGASVNGKPLGVCNYLLMFQSQIQDLEELRTLAQRLKVLSRTDVIVVLHKQRNLLRWLGPVKPEELLIKDMSISHWLEFTTALSITNPIGNDWRMLASKLDIPRTYLDLWMQRNHNPAEMVLKTFMVRVSEATVGRIFDLMIEMEREDLAAML